MSDAEHVSESTVSGTRAAIPEFVRRELDIDDGDQLRWVFTDDGTLRVEVVHQGAGSFSEFTGYEGERTDVVEDHDSFGIEADARNDPE